MTDIVPVERITDKIYLLRGKKVLMDRDLVRLYGVETRILVQGVKRNIERFPSDFMFQLTQDEFDSLRSQIVISKGKGGRRDVPTHGAILLFGKNRRDIFPDAVIRCVRFRKAPASHELESLPGSEAW